MCSHKPSHEPAANENTHKPRVHTNESPQLCVAQHKTKHDMNTQQTRNRQDKTGVSEP